MIDKLKEIIEYINNKLEENFNIENIIKTNLIELGLNTPDTLDKEIIEDIKERFLYEDIEEDCFFYNIYQDENYVGQIAVYFDSNFKINRLEWDK